MPEAVTPCNRVTFFVRHESSSSFRAVCWAGESVGSTPLPLMSDEKRDTSRAKVRTRPFCSSWRTVSVVTPARSMSSRRGTGCCGRSGCMNALISNSVISAFSRRGARDMLSKAVRRASALPRSKAGSTNVSRLGRKRSRIFSEMTTAPLSSIFCATDPMFFTSVSRPRMSSLVRPFTFSVCHICSSRGVRMAAASSASMSGLTSTDVSDSTFRPAGRAARITSPREHR